MCRPISPDYTGTIVHDIANHDVSRTFSAKQRSFSHHILKRKPQEKKYTYTLYILYSTVAFQ